MSATKLYGSLKMNARLTTPQAMDRAAQLFAKDEKILKAVPNEKNSFDTLPSNQVVLSENVIHSS